MTLVIAAMCGERSVYWSWVWLISRMTVVCGADLVEPAEQGLADVAADDVVDARLSRHRADQRGRGRLAARAGDPDGLARAELQEEAHLRGDGDAEFAGADERRVVAQDRLRDGDEVEALPGRAAVGR